VPPTVPPNLTTTEYLYAIEAGYQRVLEMVAGMDAQKAAEPPKAGRWSIVENLRHLVFVEEGLGRWLPGGVSWSGIELAPPGLQDRLRSEGVGVNPTTDLLEVLTVWAEVRKRTAELSGKDSAEVRKALWQNLRHLRNHIDDMERDLRMLERTRR
jgi:hypothetical protein